VVNGIKELQKSKSYSKCRKPRFSRNNPDELGIAKLTKSFEEKKERFLDGPSPFFPPLLPSQSQSTTARKPKESLNAPKSFPRLIKAIQEEIDQLCESLKLKEEVKEKSRNMAEKAEDPSLASRHSSTLAAAFVLHAAGKAVTAVALCKQASVSACSLRKALRAVQELA